MITLNSDSKNGQDMDQEEVNEPDEEAQFAMDETFGRGFDAVAEGIQLMDLLQAMVTAIVRAKKTPSPTQAKQLADMTQDVKIHLNRLQAKHLQFQRKYLEQSKIVKKLDNKGSKDVTWIQERPATKQYRHTPQ